MDVRLFFQKIRQVEDAIRDEYVVIISEETAEGGRAGVATEVTRNAAARLVVEGKARLATEDESTDFRAAQREAFKAAEMQESASRVHVTVVSEADVRALKGTSRGQKNG